MAEVLWYYARDDQQFGPVSAQELKQLATAGALSPADLVWKEGMEEWAEAGRVKGLFPEPVETPPPDHVVAAPMRPEEKPPIVEPTAVTVPVAKRWTYQAILLTVQAVLWGVCILVVLLGGVMFLNAILSSTNDNERAAAGMLYTTFFVGAYVIARAGEKVARLIETYLSNRKK